MSGFAVIIFAVFPEGDQAGKGSDQCAHATNIHTQQKVLIVFRELGQQNCRRHIADDLTGQHREQ